MENAVDISSTPSSFLKRGGGDFIPMPIRSPSITLYKEDLKMKNP